MERSARKASAEGKGELTADEEGLVLGGSFLDEVESSFGDQVGRVLPGMVRDSLAFGLEAVVSYRYCGWATRRLMRDQVKVGHLPL